MASQLELASIPARTGLALALLALGGNALAAQTTHLVGPGGHAQIRDALALAAPGDVIEVQPGTYAHFKVDVGLTIRAQIPGTVSIEYDASLTPPDCQSSPQCLATEGPTRLAPPPGQTVHCVGLVFLPTVTPGFAGMRHRVVVTSGAAAFDRCTLSANGVDALRVDDARVHLQGSSLASVGTGIAGCGLWADQAVVSAVDCSFAGPPIVAGFPGAAVRLRSAQFQGSQLVLTGGTNVFGPGGAALDLDASSAAWISDSTLVGGNTTCPVNAQGGAGRIDRSTLTPASAGCTSLPGGLVIGLESSAPLQNGAPFTVDFRTAPHQPLLVYASLGLGHLPLPGLTDQPVSIDVSSSWFAGALLADATGLASRTWQLPAGQLVGLPLYVLGVGPGIGATAGIFVLSSPAGGLIE